MPKKKKIIIGITGASGTIYAIDLIKKMREIPPVKPCVFPVIMEDFIKMRS